MIEQAGRDLSGARERIATAVESRGVLCGDGLAVWGDLSLGGVADIAADCAVIGIEHRVVAAVRPPRDGDRRRRSRPGEEVRIGRDALAAMVTWLPALRIMIDELPTGAPGFGMRYAESRCGGMAVVRWLSLATDWPSWTRDQAAAMGLLCAECAADLREPSTPAVLPFNLPPTDRPGARRRLLCGPCAAPVFARTMAWKPVA